MSLKVSFLDPHLDLHPLNLGALSDEHGEGFHQEISSTEHLCQGKWSPSILFCFLDRAFSIMKTEINQRNAQINSG